MNIIKMIITHSSKYSDTDLHSDNFVTNLKHLMIQKIDFKIQKKKLCGKFEFV